MNKRLILRGVNIGGGKPIVDAYGTGGVAIGLSGGGITLEGFTATGGRNGIFLDSSSNSTLNDNNASNNDGTGIFMAGSWNNTLTGNSASNNGGGIFLKYSNNNTLIGNNVSNNFNLGIALYDVSGNNKIYNNIFDNTNNFDSYDSFIINAWNITKTPGTNILGGPYLGGNFWAYPNVTGFSQTCADTDKDGLCDSNYTLDYMNVDYLPLTIPPPVKINISGTKYNGSGINLGTMTMTTGQTWSLGAGYEMTINAIDARTTPRQVWFTLNKNGGVIDEVIGVMGQTYNYNSLFFIKINNIFSGSTSDMVQFTETFLVENTAEPLSGWKIYLWNTTTGVEIANTTTDLNGLYKFTGLLPGVYKVSEEMKGGWVNVVPLFQIVTISTNDLTNLNFTNMKLIPRFNITNLMVFVRGGDNAVYTKNWNGSVWSGWQGLGGYISSNVTAISSGSNITIFVRGGDNAVYTQNWNGSVWSGWQGLGGYVTSEPV